MITIIEGVLIHLAVLTAFISGGFYLLYRVGTAENRKAKAGKHNGN
jgi:hypothetical protein